MAVPPNVWCPLKGARALPTRAVPKLLMLLGNGRPLRKESKVRITRPWKSLRGGGSDGRGRPSPHEPVSIVEGRAGRPFHTSSSEGEHVEHVGALLIPGVERTQPPIPLDEVEDGNIVHLHVGDVTLLRKVRDDQSRHAGAEALEVHCWW